MEKSPGHERECEATAGEGTFTPRQESSQAGMTRSGAFPPEGQISEPRGKRELQGPGVRGAGMWDGAGHPDCRRHLGSNFIWGLTTGELRCP